eukprot:789513-Pelagomonas_calceolata.AAC.11
MASSGDLMRAEAGTVTNPRELMAGTQHAWTARNRKKTGGRGMQITHVQAAEHRSWTRAYVPGLPPSPDIISIQT